MLTLRTHLPSGSRPYLMSEFLPCYKSILAICTPTNKFQWERDIKQFNLASRTKLRTYPEYVSGTCDLHGYDLIVTDIYPDALNMRRARYDDKSMLYNLQQRALDSKFILLIIE